MRTVKDPPRRATRPPRTTSISETTNAMRTAPAFPPRATRTVRRRRFSTRRRPTRRRFAAGGISSASRRASRVFPRRNRRPRSLGTSRDRGVRGRGRTRGCGGSLRGGCPRARRGMARETPRFGTGSEHAAFSSGTSATSPRSNASANARAANGSTPRCSPPPPRRRPSASTWRTRTRTRTSPRRAWREAGMAAVLAAARRAASPGSSRARASYIGGTSRTLPRGVRVELRRRERLMELHKRAHDDHARRLRDSETRAPTRRRFDGFDSRRRRRTRDASRRIATPPIRVSPSKMWNGSWTSVARRRTGRRRRFTSSRRRRWNDEGRV